VIALDFAIMIVNEYVGNGVNVSRMHVVDREDEGTIEVG